MLISKPAGSRGGALSQDTGLPTFKSGKSVLAVKKSKYSSFSKSKYSEYFNYYTVYGLYGMTLFVELTSIIDSSMALVHF